jgi:hypothetical protein
MSIYPVCKAAIAGVAIMSTTLFTAGCSYAPGPESAAASTDSAAQSSQSTASTAEVKKGVSTNHDIYHSKTLEVPAGKPVPAITVSVEPDPIIGWNLYVDTANFTFTPSKVNGESSPSEGHAQLYLNDQPMQRIYSSWTHLLELPAGKNELRVTLVANGFETITTQGSPIEETATIEVYQPEPPASPEASPETSPEPEAAN